jgi:hypothetical protein
VSRKSEKLEVISLFFPEEDGVIPARYVEVEELGISDCDLRCGQDGKLLLRNFSVKEAQNHFRMENRRVVIKCPACGSYNLLASAVEKGPDGNWVDLPSGE